MYFTITFENSFILVYQGLVENLTQLYIHTYKYVITSKYKYASLLKCKVIRRNRQCVWKIHSKMKNTICYILHL